MGRYLDRFRITGEERELLLAWKLKQLVARGVNPGLLLGAFSAIHGRGTPRGISAGDARQWLSAT